MEKRLFAALLSLTLAVTFLPLSAQAAELPRLPTPTDLKWGEHWGEKIPGCASWRMEHHLGEAEVCYYNTADETDPVIESNWELDPETQWADTEFVESSNRMESGTYYFTVQLKGDGETYGDSEIARSDTWTYTKPSAKLPTPAAPVFLPEGTIPEGWEYAADEADAFIHWERPEHAMGGGYVTNYYFSATDANATDAASLEFAGGSSSIDFGGFDALRSIGDFPPGYYYARVYSVSRDITKCQNSDWSPLSAAYYYTGSGDRVVASGVMGAEGKQLDWSYNGLGQVSVSGDLDEGETVLAACYDEKGRFTGLKALDAQHGAAQLDAGAERIKIFWLDAGREPVAEGAVILDMGD